MEVTILCLKLLDGTDSQNALDGIENQYSIFSF